MDACPRQGPQGTPGAAATKGGRGVRAVSEPAARRTRPAGGVPESSERPADHARDSWNREALRNLSERRSFDPPAQLSPRLRHSPARRRRRSSRHTGIAGTRAALNHAEIYPGVAGGPDGGVRQGAPQGMSGRDAAGLRAEFRPMLRLSIPLALAELGWMVAGIVDTIMAGPFGPAAVGAGSLGGNLFYPIAIW